MIDLDAISELTLKFFSVGVAATAALTTVLLFFVKEILEARRRKIASLRTLKLIAEIALKELETEAEPKVSYHPQQLVSVGQEHFGNSRVVNLVAALADAYHKTEQIDRLNGKRTNGATLILSGTVKGKLVGAIKDALNALE